MSQSIKLPADELARLVVAAARNAHAQGYWTGAETIERDAARHLVTYLGLILGGDGNVDAQEMEIFEQVWTAVTGETPSSEELLTSVRSSVRRADDPDALQDYLTTTPEYLRAVVAMDRDLGTHNAEQVVTSLSGLGLAVLAADGRAEPEEDSVFTMHLDHLRREVGQIRERPAS